MRSKRPKIDKDYTYAVVDTLINMIETTGDIDRSCQTIPITRKVFDAWLKNHEEFAQRVEDAEKIFRANTPLALKAAAKRELNKHLLGNQQKVTTTTESFFDAENNPTGKKVSVKAEKLPSPQWAIERVLGPSITELDALKVLVESQWLEEDVVGDVILKFNQLNDEIKEIISRTNSSALIKKD